MVRAAEFAGDGVLDIVFFFSASWARRMPRREGEVFRFGTAMAAGSWEALF